MHNRLLQYANNYFASIAEVRERANFRSEAFNDVLKDEDQTISLKLIKLQTSID